MNIFSTITGLLIAAVLHVPGTTQREVTKVEDEPVVKEEVAMQTQDLWFMVDVSQATNPSDQGQQVIQTAYDGDIGTPCPGGSTICAVRLRIPADADPSDFENQTVADALSNGASAPTGGIQYAHQS
ncbi:hypothetical protein [Parapedobacter koreensis]|uniref:Uncharacterized protein n=1 Tax=Parapedobacter koreensis TaxID=332977 RepID=A0A1H7GTA8_9SPHI|nr:hypothetical protein [Parapedobacter koreensis]SEK41259.1 hypothetical protein SAMN05421740_101795 [Parapedobacter koreensis]